LKDGGTNVKVQKIFILKNNMKNIHLLPTDKPSRLVKIYNEADKKLFELKLDIEVNDNFKEYQNIYITNSEEIKEGDWYSHKQINYLRVSNSTAIPMDAKKVILTTDQDLIADGVQAIDDEFLEWFVKNPSCEFVEVYEVEGKLFAEPTIPKEEPKQETLEEAAKDYIENTMKFSFNSLETKTQANRMLKCIEFGAKWQAKRMYSEEEVIAIVEKSRETGLTAEYLLLTEQFKKK
jgi:hypothetical protein